MVTLVTGADGMVGPRLLKQLVREKEPVRAFVHDIQPSSVLNSIRTITPDVVAGDVRKPTSLKLALQDVSVVYHLAAVSHLSRNRDLYGTNTQGTANLLEASLSRGVKRFIYVSSVAAAGHNGDRHTPMTEDALPKPCTGYGRSRLLAEELVNNAHQEHGLKTTILRPCWIYGPGPGISPRMVRFIEAIAGGKAPLFGKGENLASLTHVDNLLSVFPRILRSRKSIGQTYSIADEHPYMMIEVYQAVADALGIPLRARRIPRWVLHGVGSTVRLGDIIGVNLNTLRLLKEMGLNITCSIEKAKRELGYAPRKSLRQGMAECVGWCRANGVVA